MKIFTIIKFVSILATLCSASFSTFAVPITFEFTGTVVDKILSYGFITQPPYETKEYLWRGNLVHGTVVIDTDTEGLYPPDQDDTWYSSTPYDNVGDWLSFTWTNPDGKTYSSIDNNEPIPRCDENHSTANFFFSPDADIASFYAGESFSRPCEQPQGISLNLSARGPDALDLLSGSSFDTLEINLQHANLTNYGAVIYNDGKGTDFRYFFSIDTFTRVPEPSSWALLITAFCALIFTRRKHVHKIHF